MDLKVMPKSYKGHKYILCIIDEVTNFVITALIHQARSEEVGDALIENVITNCCVSQNTKLWTKIVHSCLMNYLLKKFDIKIRTVAPYNHQSLQAESRIKSLSDILTKN